MHQKLEKLNSEIYWKGRIEILDKPCIGVVGSRKCTVYGETIAKEISKLSCKYGATLISGMARGIDGICHRTVLEEGGDTVGVLASGLDVYYPSENRKLQDRMGKDGLLLTEYPLGVQPRKYFFPTRNRIISCLSDALVVIEAGTRSGTLITAECACEQGKEVYAVPGNITSVYSMGPNKLILEGAKPLIMLEQVFIDLGLNPSPSITGITLGDAEERVYRVIAKKGLIAISELPLLLPMNISEINGILTVLEIKGLVYCDMGKVMIAKFQ